MKSAKRWEDMCCVMQLEAHKFSLEDVVKENGNFPLKAQGIQC